MDERIYTITLEDGTQIRNLYMNGTNFVSQEEIKPEIFYGKLGTVTISNGEMEETHTNMEFVQVMKIDDEYYFVLIDIPENEIRNRKLRSDLDYLAMMTDIEIY